MLEVVTKETAEAPPSNEHKCFLARLNIRPCKRAESGADGSAIKDEQSAEQDAALHCSQRQLHQPSVVVDEASDGANGTEASRAAELNQSAPVSD